MTKKKTDVIGVIGVRLNSSRLPKKQFLDLAGAPLISRLYTRLERVKSIEKIILATTSDSYNASIIDWAKRNQKNVFSYDGDVNNVVDRVDNCVKKYNAEIIVYICGDSPLIEPVTVNNIIIDLLNNPNYNIGSLKLPANGSVYIHEGFAVYRRNIWDKIVKNSTNSYYREHVGSVVKQFHSGLVATETEELEEYSAIQHRISVDTFADYIFMKTLYDRWYYKHDQNTIVSLAWVIRQLKSDKELVSINSHVVQRDSSRQNINVILVTETSPARGLGHLSRCVVLARAMQEYLSASTIILIVGKHVEIELISNTNTKWCLDQSSIEQQLMKLIDNKKINILIVDSPGCQLDLHKLRTIQPTLRLYIMAIECLRHQIRYLDLFLVPSFYLQESYASIDKSKLLYGWDYYLVTPHSNRANWLTNGKITIFSGGSDVEKFGEWLPGKLDEYLASGSELIWVQGPYADNPKLPDLPRLRWQIVHNPKDIQDIIQKCSYALSLYGVTFFELLSYGIPTVVYVDKQHLDEFYLLKKLGLASVENQKEKLVDKLVKLVNNKHKSSTISQRAKRYIDGKSTQRIANKLQTLIDQ